MRHVEWAGAGYIVPKVIDTTDEFSDSFGQDLGDDKIALVLDYDDVVVIEAADVDELKALRNRITKAISDYTTPRHTKKEK